MLIFGAMGYNNFTVFLFILSGWMILRFDRRRYGMADMKPERRAASIVGWINVTLGVVGFVGYKIVGMLVH